MHLLRKFFIAGLLVWLPIAATLLVLKLLINVLNKFVLLLPLEWQPEALLGFSVPGFGIMLSILVLVLTGLFVTNIFGRRLFRLWESILTQIPMVRTIYGTVKQVLEILLSPNNQAFRRVVLIEYPRKGIWSMGFQTNDEMTLGGNVVSNLSAVFIPTTPNPTSGFILMLPPKDITVLDMSVEDGFKLIISLGVIIPQQFAKDFS